MRLAQVVVPAAIAASLTPAPAVGRAISDVYAIPAGPLGKALTLFTRQSGAQILFSPELVQGLRSAGIAGRFDTYEALGILLAGTGLRARRLSGGVIILEASPRSLSSDTALRATPAAMPVDETAKDVVVTALKRGTLLADTPLSISVIDGSAITGEDAHELRKLVRLLPGLSATDTGSAQQRLTIRGVYGTGEATVSTYYGETPVTAPGGTTFDPGRIAPDIELVDVGRVELLRGPQSTLYGASSMGGTLRILFNSPDPERASGTAIAGIDVPEKGGIGAHGSLVLNVPIVTDHLAIRVVGYERSSSGYIDRPSLGLKDRGGVRDEGGRLALAWMPDDRVTLTLGGALHRARTDDATYWLPATGRYVNDQPTKTPVSSSLDLANIVLEWRLGGATLTATASAYSSRVLQDTDYTGVLSRQPANADSCRRYTGLPAGTTCSTDQQATFAAFARSRLPAVLYQPNSLVSHNGEVRFSSTAGKTVEWTLGGFFENRHDQVDSYALRADAVTGAVIVPFDVTGLRTIRTGLDQRAVFGEASVHVLSDLTATAGGRYYDYRRTGQGDVTTPNPLTGTADLAAGPFVTSAQGKSLKFDLSYRTGRNAMLYLQAAEGFRPGGVNITPGLSAIEREYRPDHLWSYEFGGKVQLGARAAIDFSVYHIDWSDMIFSAASANGAFAYNVNVGTVRINGGEVQARWSMAPGVRLTAQGSYVDARLATDQTSASPHGLGRRGDALPTVPHASGRVAIRGTRSIGDAMLGALELSVSAVGPSASQFNPYILYYERSPGYALANIEATIGRGGWHATFSLDNMFGVVAAGRYLSNTFATHQLYSVSPRTLSLALERDF